MKKTLFFLLIIFTNVAVYYLYSSTTFFENAIHIAVAGPMGNSRGEAMRKGIELYRDEINKQGGIDGRKLELLFFDDNDDPETALKIASEIADDNRALLVLGHYGSSASAAAGIHYKRNEIPVITASATAESVILGNEWYFRVIPGNALEARFVANYIDKGMKKRLASIIYTNDDYGIPLAEHFEKTVESMGMKLVGKWVWDKDQSPDDQVKKIMEELSATEDPGIIFFATHSSEGVKIITEITHAGKSYPIIGSYAFSRNFLHELKTYPMEWSNPGYYTDGIYFVTPFMIDIGGANTFDFRKAFHKKHGEYPGVIAACYYDATYTAVQAIKKSRILGKKQIREDRRKVREALTDFYNDKNSVSGITGSIWFDEDGGVRRHYIVGVWQDHKPSPTFSQYLQNTVKVDNMVQAVLDGKMILTDGITMSHIHVVYAGMEIIGVSDINMEKSEFTADFHLWFRYAGDFDDKNIEFENALTPVLPEPVSEEVKEGITTRKYRVRGRFRADFEFHDYPFVTDHKLTIRFRHTDQTNEKLIYFPDILYETINSDLNEWHIDSVLFYQDAVSKITSLGNPKFFGSNHTPSYSRFNSEIYVRKNESVRSLLLKFLPAMLLLPALCLSHFVSIRRLRICLGILMTALVANTVFHLRHLSDLPLGYMTVMDGIYIIIYLLVIISLFILLLIYRLDRQGDEKKRNMLIWSGRLLYPFIIILGIVFYLSWMLDV